MRVILSALAAAAAIAFAGPARADVIESFAMTGSLSDGATIGGDLLVDVTSGVVTGSSVTVGAPDNFYFEIVMASFAGGYGPGEYSVNITNAALTEDLDFAIETSSLVGFSGAAVVGTLFDLTTSEFGPSIVSANLTPVPEPSSLALIAVGLLGIGVAVRGNGQYRMSVGTFSL